MIQPIHLGPAKKDILAEVRLRGQFCKNQCIRRRRVMSTDTLHERVCAPFKLGRAMRRSWIALMLLLMGACTGPVRSFPVYESKARQTASAVASAAQTAALAVDAAAGDTFEGGGWLGHQRQPQNVSGALPGDSGGSRGRTRVELGRCWHEPEGRGSCLWADDGVDDAGRVAAVLGAFYAEELER